jgi:predicted O-methyltransferase YrrM
VDGKVFGIDLSDSMSQIARDNISRAGLSNRIGLHQGDAGNLPLNARNLIEKSGFIPFQVIEKNMNGLPVVMLSARKYGQ